ncbi:hypothetical protein A3A59_05950 [Candidatus Gottesmanbacteria bacterium RIFCSPLOWO2_01_FULL_42_10]|nr:MAG: hypothetical protein A3A59_05950 [Candidatus Gottesmanbacteria bacterium RIFCSPLOWO2_01_FULL_42_10]
MLITTITSQKKRKDRVNIFVDGTYAFALDLDLMVKHRLRVGQTLSDIEVKALVKESELAKWYSQCLNLISLRPRSKQELGDYLTRHEVGELTQKTVLNQLTAKNWLNDEKFAEWFVEQRLTFRPKGSRALQMELKQKGISTDIIQEVLTKHLDETTQIGLARQIVAKKLTFWQKLPPLKLRLKLQNLLLRRGFSYAVINRVLEAETAATSDLT